MNRALGIVIALACAVAALAVLPRLRRGESAAPVPPAREHRDTSGAAHRDESSTSGGRSGASELAAGGGTDIGTGVAPRRRLPPRSAGGGAGVASVDPAAPAPAPGTAPEHVRRRGEAPLGEHALPAAGSAGTGRAGDTDDAGRPIPEVAYDGGPDHVFDTGAQAEVTDAGSISGDAGTVAFWLKPEWQPNNQDDASFVQFGDSGLQITKNVNFLRFEYVDPVTGVEYGVGTNIGDWSEGDWRHVTATWTGNVLALYVDGKLVSENRFPRPPDFQNETKLYVGSAFPSGAPVALGQLTNLTVLNRASSAGDVGSLFGSSTHPR